MRRHPEENARTVAVESLCQWEERREPMTRIFAERAARLDAVERRLARSVVYGVLRRQETLDAILAHFCRHRPEQMKSRTRMTLRVGVFQLMFLSRIPASAAVNTTVNTLKAARQPSWLVGFVNGVLRRIAAARGELERFDLDAGGLPRTNHPQWLCARWQKHYGPELMRAICALNNSEPPLTLRVNTCRIGRTDFLAALQKGGINAHPGKLSPLALVVEGYPGPVGGLHGYAEGLFQVQDEGAQLISMLLAGPSGSCRVLDACAGLGGKSGHLVELLPPGSTVLALEPDGYRFRLLLEGMERLGHGERITPTRGNLEDFVRTAPAPFDAILVDAPCSGTGVIRRQPDIRWNRQPEDLPRYAGTQLALVRQAAALLRKDGVLVYATCSLEPEENSLLIAEVLAACPNLRLEPVEPYLPASATALARQGFFLSLPTDGCDGFFAARLRRVL